MPGVNAGAHPLGVYVHFPYCRKRCPYCDFEIHVRRRVRGDELASAVIAELGARRGEIVEEGRPRALRSIYFGGGTPSLWAPECVARVIGAIREVAAVGGGIEERSRERERERQHEPIEITLEVNPDDLPPGRLEALARAGVNRLSIGAQSFDAARLVELGRLHGVGETVRAVEQARVAGFRSLSLDLIFGLPGQRPEELERELAALVALGPDHVSAYQLTVEERTPFGARRRRGELSVIDEGREAELFALVEERLGAAGLEHYEVSSYARPGHRAVHNSLYWSGGEWLGLGPSAHSFRRLPGGGGERRANPRNIDRYLARYLARWQASSVAARLPIVDEEEAATDTATATATAAATVTVESLGPEELAREAMWLGLRRLLEGVDRAAFRERFGEDPVARFAVELAPLQAGALIVVDEGAVRLTARGALLADEVGLRFL